MRGRVLYYDETQGFGFIQGADGNRYTFAAEDMRRRTPIVKGTAVEFRPSGDRARDILVMHEQAAGRVAGMPSGGESITGGAGPVAAVSVPPQHFGRFAEHEDASQTSLWGYFQRALTTNYVSFGGRARRKEYWGYILFWTIAATIIGITGLALDDATGTLDTIQFPVIMSGLLVIWILGTFLPGLGLTIRRIHDIGLSGWFYLLVFVPSVGALIILVFTLIASQKHDNRWGPVPDE
jgi:uncharacterized membrane protein YhaH (DUF805 family)/cold shock CspA family protein